jgi:CheY-like chemotaxis protein
MSARIQALPPAADSVAPTEPTWQPGILVVDDDESIRAIMGMALRQVGCNVWLAASGPEALQLYRENRLAISLILLDVRMPQMDGPQTLRALQRINPQVRCCFVTGDAGGQSEEELLELGVIHIFHKPFAFAEFQQSVRDLVGSR